MEVVGIAASFTGILAFAGQAIEGIIQLRTFFNNVPLAPRRTADLLKDLDSLTDTLSEIQQLVITLEKTSAEKLGSGAALNTKILKCHLKGCAENIESWVKVASNGDPRTDKGLKAFSRKVEIAADKSGFEELGRKISAHRQIIGIRLSILGRSLDHAGIERINELSTKFDGLMESHLRLNDSINKTMAAQSTRNETLPEKLESQLQPLTSLIGDNFERMSAKHSENQQSIRSLSHSLSSLASHVSQLLERANLADTNTDDEAGFERSPRAHKQYKRTRQTSEWTCDSLSGIDDGFSGVSWVFSLQILFGGLQDPV